MATTTGGIWFPGPNDAVGRISFEQLARSIDLEADGWQQIRASAPEIWIRRHAGGVYLHAQGAGLTIPNNFNLAIGNGIVPPELRPPPTRNIRAGCFLGGTWPGVLHMEAATGTVMVSNATGATRDRCDGYLWWPLG